VRSVRTTAPRACQHGSGTERTASSARGGGPLEKRMSFSYRAPCEPLRPSRLPIRYPPCCPSRIQLRRYCWSSDS
jgi:hypothetical protein